MRAPRVGAGFIRLVRGPHEHPALDYLLAHADPAAPLAERVAWLTELLRWIRVHRPPKALRAKEAEPGATDSAGGESDATQALVVADSPLALRIARVRFVLHVLNRQPDWKRRCAETLRSILRDTRGLRLYATTGLPQEYGFWGETLHRIAARFLPEPPLGADLAQAFVALFPSVDDDQLLLALSPQTRDELRALLRFEEPSNETCWAVVRRDLDDAVVLLASQVCAIGISDAVRLRTGCGELSHSPFVALGPAAESYLEAVRRMASDGEQSEAHARFMAELARCRDALAQAIVHLEEYGVSVALVYRIEVARQELDRIETLLALAIGSNVAVGDVSRFVAELVRNMHSRQSVGALFRTNLFLLARKITERTGKTGEHYITRSRAEYAEMLRSASKGGALTSLTIFAKFALAGAALAPFFEGLVASLNYAVSFCAIQFVHGTLATKQPAMTAATMAAKLRAARHHGRLREFVDEVANLTRSQVAAIAGNIAVVVPAALLLERAWVEAGGAFVPPPQKAQQAIEALSVWGVTPFFAAFTGVLLWISAILSGWLENWATFRRLPEAIAEQRRLVYAFGPARMKRVAAWLERNIAGIGGNVALGFMLGMTPVVAAFFGVPLDVRHVTLSAGSLALAASTLGFPTLTTSAFWLACAGVVAIGALNLGVSFTLALLVAIRSTGAGHLSRRRVFRAVVARLFAAPRDFLLPPPVGRAELSTRDSDEARRP